MSIAVPTSSRCPSASKAGSTLSHMWRTMTCDSRTRRSTGQPAPAANIQATLPPASSNETVALSNAVTSPRSWSMAAT